MDFRKKRWISLFAGLGIEALSGLLYAWSVFQAPLMEKYGWSVTQVALTYSLSSISTMLGTMFFGGKAHRLLSVRKELLLGTLLYSLFMMATAFIGGRLILLYLFLGVLSAVGQAFVYPLLIGYAVEMFPDHSGFAGGVMTAGYGLGSVLWAPLATRLHAMTGDISQVFLILGAFFLCGMLLLSLLIFSPPPEFRREMLELRAAHVHHHGHPAIPDSLYDVDTPAMLRTPLFYMAFLTLLLCISCGNMLINQAAPIMTLTFGDSPAAAAGLVSILAVFNVTGRLLWGPVSDRLGKTTTLVVINILLVLFTLGMLLFSDRLPFTAALLGVILCYGGLACLIAPLTAELFGHRHVTENYSVMFCVFGCSSLVGPPLISVIRDMTGAYTIAYICLVTFAMLGLGMSLVLFHVKTKTK